MADHNCPQPGSRSSAPSAVLAGKTQLLAREAETAPPAQALMDAGAIPDERLELIFTCCYPALALEAQVALTLRTLGGLSTEEIALAFLVPPETMSKRLTRAKRKIRDRRDEAREAYRRALGLARTEAEQRFLAGRLAETAAAGQGATRQARRADGDG